MNLFEVEDLLKGMPDRSLGRELVRPSGAVPLYMVMAEISRRRRIREGFGGGDERGMETSVADDMRRGLMSLSSPDAQQVPAVSGYQHGGLVRPTYGQRPYGGWALTPWPRSEPDDALAGRAEALVREYYAKSMPRTAPPAEPQVPRGIVGIDVPGVGADVSVSDGGPNYIDFLGPDTPFDIGGPYAPGAGLGRVRDYPSYGSYEPESGYGPGFLESLGEPSPLDSPFERDVKGFYRGAYDAVAGAGEGVADAAKRAVQGFRKVEANVDRYFSPPSEADLSGGSAVDYEAEIYGTPLLTADEGLPIIDKKIEEEAASAGKGQPAEPSASTQPPVKGATTPLGREAQEALPEGQRTTHVPARTSSLDELEYMTRVAEELRLAGRDESPLEDELARIEEMRADLEKSAKIDKWLALAQLGASMAASRSPTFAGAFGEGAAQGIKALQEAAQSKREGAIDLLGLEAEIAKAREAARQGDLNRAVDLYSAVARKLAVDKQLAMRGGGGESMKDRLARAKMLDLEIEILADQLQNNLAMDEAERAEKKARLQQLLAIRNSLSGIPIGTMPAAGGLSLEGVDAAIRELGGQ